CQRIGSLTSGSVARWGRVDVSAMLAHLRVSALMALGELPVASKNMRAFQAFPMKHLLLHVAPFPKGAPTAPELLVPSAAPVDAIRSDCGPLVRRAQRRSGLSS